jgi:hypothetical protein
MKQYQVFIQEKLYKTIESEFISNILRQISIDIQNGNIPDFDDAKPAAIKIIPVS